MLTTLSGGSKTASSGLVVQNPRAREISEVRDGFPNTSLILVEHGYKEAEQILVRGKLNLNAHQAAVQHLVFLQSVYGDNI